MVNSLFKFLEKNKVVLDANLKKTITESFDSAVSEKTSDIKGTLTKTESRVKKLEGLLKEAELEIKALRTTKLDEVKKEVELFKENTVDKLSRYLEYKINELIPEHLIEAQAKLEVYEPLVESVQKAFADKGIKIDSKGHGLLNSAKSEIVKTRKKLDEAISEKMELEEAIEKLLGKFLLKEKCEGLTPSQTKRVQKIFEGAGYDEIEKRFDSVRELVITEADAPTKKNKVEEPKKVNEEFSPEKKTDMSDLEKAWAKYV